MRKNPCEFRQGSGMSDISEEGYRERMRAIIGHLGGQRAAGETMDRVLERAARRTGIAFNRVRAYWYGKIKTVTAVDWDRTKSALLAADREQTRMAEERRRALLAMVQPETDRGLARILARLAPPSVDTEEAASDIAEDFR